MRRSRTEPSGPCTSNSITSFQPVLQQEGTDSNDSAYTALGKGSQRGTAVLITLRGGGKSSLPSLNEHDRHRRHQSVCCMTAALSLLLTEIYDCCHPTWGV